MDPSEYADLVNEIRWVACGCGWWVQVSVGVSGQKPGNVPRTLTAGLTSCSPSFFPALLPAFLLSCAACFLSACAAAALASMPLTRAEPCRRLMAAADHPNLLTFYEAFVDRNQVGGRKGSTADGRTWCRCSPTPWAVWVGGWVGGWMMLAILRRGWAGATAAAREM